MVQARDREQLTKLQLEIGRFLTGGSVYSPEGLSQAIQAIKGRVAEGNGGDILKGPLLYKRRLYGMGIGHRQESGSNQQIWLAETQNKKMIKMGK